MRTPLFCHSRQVVLLQLRQPNHKGGKKEIDVVDVINVVVVDIGVVLFVSFYVYNRKINKENKLTNKLVSR